jgi:F-type H+-transporting ATPase subunit b
MEILHHHETWEIVGFLIVVAILLWKGVPGMVGKMLDKRAQVIAAELEEAKRLRAEAAVLLADYQKRAAGAEAEAQSIIAAATAEAAQFQKESRAALEAQIARRAAAAQDKIAQAEAAALNEIRGLAADTAVNAAQKLIAARLDEARAKNLIADSIKGLGDKLN